MGDTNNEILLTKSHDNYSFVIEYTSRKEFSYHIAINRMYYSLFQYMSYIVIDLGYDKYDDKGKDSHKQTFDNFFYAFRDKLPHSDRVAFKSYFSDLKNGRIKADYKGEQLSNEEFRDYKTMFKNMRALIVKCHSKLKGVDLIE